ncbi:MAG: pyruvate kinase, partial [Gammaproteobacteria bacterium]|nr:pyruvate kinase [Gammaproteobacteria bacterium]
MQIRRTKIIATLGPATDSPDDLRALLEAGADVLRINLSHGTHEEQAARAEQVRVVARSVNREVAILADLRGPKIRLEKFVDGSVELQTGDTFTLDTSDDPAMGDQSRVGVTYKGLADDVSPGDLLLLDDGLLTMLVVETKDRNHICEVEAGGVLGDRKGINLQGGGLSLPGIAEHDIEDIPRAAAMGADYLAVSFPRNAQDMDEARRLLREAGSDASLVAKIERTEAIENLEEIIAASDAVLIARGDLGVEIGDAELPGLQKLITTKSLEQNRVVITATQMMQSMVDSPIPTRAEVLDVANSVLDGTDAVMLSAETAVGQHPDTVVEAMNRICLGAERHADTRLNCDHLNVQFQRIDQAIAMAAMFMATNVQVQAIIALTESGSTAQWLSRVRSSVPIFALSPNRDSRRRMSLYRGVYPIAHDFPSASVEETLARGVNLLFQQGLIKAGERIIMTMGDHTGHEGGTNSLRLVQIGKDGFVEYNPSLDICPIDLDKHV